MLAFEDNAAAGSAFAKGRSPSPSINYYCRKNAATAMASDIQELEPWLETSKMPADKASRTLHAASVVRAEAPRSASGSAGETQHPRPLQGVSTPVH